MELTDFDKITPKTYDDVIGQIEPQKDASKIAGYIKQLDVGQHDVIDPTKRPQKKIKKPDDDGKLVDDYVEVARNPVSYQKIIANRAAAFLCGNPIKLQATPEKGLETDFLSIFQKIWDDNKLDYKNLTLATIQAQETEVSELWYTEPAPDGYWDGTPLQGAKFRPRILILSNSKGDSLFPVFNSIGDMIAFGRGYKVEVGGKEVEHYDLYLADRIIKGEKGSSGWLLTTEANPVGKIPVIYYSQDKPEWYDVQRLIDRFETAISNQSDTNDYFGSPIMKVSGDVKGFSTKGESGKTIQLENGADAGYLIWDQSPESVKNENDLLQKLIFNMTDTPDISFEEMKGLGTFSGIALKMLFLGAHLKASLKAGGGFGEGIQRRINFIKAFIKMLNKGKFGSINLNITPEFEYFLPKNVQETIGNLADSFGAGIMSRETAVRLNPLVEDPDNELDKMKAEGDFAPEIQNV